MSYQRITPFAALGRPLEKQAIEWGGVGQTLKGWGNQISSGVQGALQSTKANMAGTGALLTGGGYQGAADAANKSWNNSGKDIAATDTRAAAHHATADATAEKNQASFARPVNTAIDAVKGMWSGGFSGMANAANDSWNKGTAVINDQRNIIANSQKTIGANSPGAPVAATAPTQAKPPAPGVIQSKTTASPDGDWGGAPSPSFGSHASQMQAAGVTSGQFIGGQLVQPGQPLSAHQKMIQGISTSMGNPQQPAGAPTPAAPTQQPDTNQFNQPGGWTTGPNGEIQPMQKQSAFAALGKSAYANYQNMGSAIPAAGPVTFPMLEGALGSMGGGANARALNPSPLGTSFEPGAQHNAPAGGSPPRALGRMPAAGTPVTPGMATDERMHAQNKLTASAGGTVPAQKAPSSVGPSAEQIAAFRKGTTTKFNPKSQLDRAKMEAMIAGNKDWSENQGARGNMATDRAEGGAAMQYNSRGRSGSVVPPAPQRGGLDMRDAYGTGGMGRPMPAMPPLTGIQPKTTISPDFDSADGMKTAFAMLEKGAAGGLAGVAQKAVAGVGKMFQGSANKARKGVADQFLKDRNITSQAMKNTATLQPPKAGVAGPQKAKYRVSGMSDAERKIMTAQQRSEVLGTATGRASAGKSLRGAANSIENSKGIQNAINYGGGAALGGAGLYGAHSMGHSSGREDGMTEGVDNGIQLGLQGAQAMQPGDPGFMGRLGDLFTGTQSGPDVATMRQGLSADRDKLIQALIAR